MKKLLSVIIVLALCLTFAACGGKGGENNESQLTLNKTSVSLALFAQTTLEAEYEGNEDLVWESSVSDVVKLESAEGKTAVITALKAGNSDVSVKTADGKFSATCRVSVAASDVQLSLIAKDGTDVYLKKGSSAYLPFSVNFGGEEFTRATINYQTDDNGVVTVQDGLITAVAVGIAEITVRAEYYGRYSNVITFSVFVTDSAVRMVVSAANITLYVDNGTADAEIYPSSCDFTVALFDGDNKNEITDYTAVIDNEDVVQLDKASKKIKGLIAGEAVIDVSYEYNGTTYTAKVFVTVLPVPGI